MDYSLSNNEYIFLYLSQIIPINDVIIKIINIKEELEKKETLEYYKDRWLNISLVYYDLIDKEGMYNFSYINCDGIPIAIKDISSKFYNNTNISYQVRSFLLEILNCPISKNERILDKNNDLWRKNDDKIYGILSKKIIKIMKKNKKFDII